MTRSQLPLVGRRPAISLSLRLIVFLWTAQPTREETARPNLDSSPFVGAAAIASSLSPVLRPRESVLRNSEDLRSRRLFGSPKAVLDS